MLEITSKINDVFFPINFFNHAVGERSRGDETTSWRIGSLTSATLWQHSALKTVVKHLDNMARSV